VKISEDNQGVIRARSRDDAPIKGRMIDEEEVATERLNSDTEEVKMDEGEVAAERTTTVLASGAAEVPTGSGSIPTAGAEVPTGRKEVMVESETPKKQKVQEQINAQIAKELEEQLAREDQKRAEQIARDAEIA
nr:hypothetical protein [Tanacetum cinerariifolium]